jgi:oligoendopeptidase F
MILLCLMVDEFESQVYTTDISGYTAKDFDALMNSVATQYFDLGYIQRNMGDINAYWREVVVEQPVYYISYGVSVISSIDLYTMALEDFEGAIATYQNICENPQEGMGFQDTITAAGLIGPFQEEFYINIVELIQNRK